MRPGYSEDMTIPLFIKGKVFLRLRSKFQIDITYKPPLLGVEPAAEWEARSIV